MEIIDDLGQSEVSHYGVAHCKRALRHGGAPDLGSTNRDERRAESELVAISFGLARAALDAGMGVTIGYAMKENSLRLLGFLDEATKGCRFPADVVPFALTDAPCYLSCDFFNWASPTTLERYRQKITLSLGKFQRFAAEVLKHELVESVEFRFTEYDEYDVEMLKLTCPVAEMVDRVLANITDVLDVPAMQVFVTR
jgi:hypothetical protein